MTEPTDKTEPTEQERFLRAIFGEKPAPADPDSTEMQRLVRRIFNRA